MIYPEAITQVSTELGIPPEVVKLAYESYWMFIRKTISALPLMEDLDEEEFSELRTNFNIPSIGKLNCTYSRWKGVKKRYKQLMNLKNDNKDKENQTYV